LLSKTNASGSAVFDVSTLPKMTRTIANCVVCINWDGMGKDNLMDF